MSTVNWTAEQIRFAGLHERMQGAAINAFKRWTPAKYEEAMLEYNARMWQQWTQVVSKGKDPATMMGYLIKMAILWVKNDRKVAGRTGRPDVYDYRSGWKAKGLPDFGMSAGEDDPALLYIALDEVGMSIAAYYDE